MNAEQDAIARIEARIRDLRSTLADDVAAIDVVQGFGGTDGVWFTLQPGARLRADHPFVVAHRDWFRPLTAAEVAAAVKSTQRHLELAAGLR
jgi:hypothetical protein